MRPPDENQPRSKRPNLFSSSHRPGGSDDNILAKLDNQAPAALPNRAAPGSRALWLGAAGIIVAGLIASLAMLAQQQGARGQHRYASGAVASGAVASGAVASGAVASGDAPPVIMVASGTGQERAQRNPGQEGDQQPDRGAQIIDEALPPLVTLARLAAPTPVLPAAPVHRTAPVERAAPVPKAAAAGAHDGRARVAQRNAAPVKTAALRPAAPMADRTPGPAPRRPRATPATRPDTTPVDTDVAILTAILAQSRHAAEREPAPGRCGAGAKCAPRTSAH